MIHVSIAHRIIPNSYDHRDRGIAVALHWEGWNLHLISYHLPSGHSRGEYHQHLDLLTELCHGSGLRDKFRNSRVAPKALLNLPVYTILGIDANAIVGPALTRLQADCIGEATLGSRSWKGAAFVNLCLELGYRICNTFAKDTKHVWTCHHGFKAEPSQIDFVCTNLPRRSQKNMGVTDIDASSSDHRPTFLEFFR